MYSGQYSAHRERRHGNSAKRGTPTQFVVFSHKITIKWGIGRKASLATSPTLIPFEALKLAAAAVLLSANVPLLFMGEEYGETAPFLYFIDHGDAGLIEAVRRGRKAEFASFGWGDVPDPHARPRLIGHAFNGRRTRRTDNVACSIGINPSSNFGNRFQPSGPGRAQDRLKVWAHRKAQALTIHRTGHSGPEALIILSLNADPTNLPFKNPQGTWDVQLDSNAPAFGGRQETPAPRTLTLAAKPTLTSPSPLRHVGLHQSTRDRPSAVLSGPMTGRETEMTGKGAGRTAGACSLSPCGRGLR